jgi:hypothetical protein
MKKIVLLAMALVMVASLSWGADLALKATWTANTDSYTVGYKLYRTDTTRTLLATIPGKTVATYNFNVTVPDNSSGTLKFKLTAYNASNVEGADSNEASYFFDLIPVPPAPAGLGISKQ